MPELSVLDNFFKTFGLPMGLLMVTLITGARGAWVFGSHYRAMVEERNYWRSIAFHNLKIAEKVTTVAEKQITPPSGD
jgi:hypothetical protein